MKSLLFSILMLASAASLAAEIYMAEDSVGNRVMISDSKCELFNLKGWKGAEFLYNGKKLKACWQAIPSGLVMVIDQDGDITGIPVQQFSKLKEV